MGMTGSAVGGLRQQQLGDGDGAPLSGAVDTLQTAQRNANTNPNADKRNAWFRDLIARLLGKRKDLKPGVVTSNTGVSTYAPTGQASAGGM